jgi:hypothetical protein
MPDAGNTPPKTKRCRGGQPGNTNALKHGFYAACIRSKEKADLEIDAEINLEEELNLVRVLIRRVLEKTEGENGLESSIRILTSISAATSRMASILRTMHFLGGDGKDGGKPNSIDNCLSQMDEEENQ